MIRDGDGPQMTIIAIAIVYDFHMHLVCDLFPTESYC